MRDIPEERRLAGFPRVAMPSIHAEVLEVWAESRTWEEFEGRLLEKYGLDDAVGFLRPCVEKGGGTTGVLYRRARERRRSDYTEPKVRLRTTDDHTGARPFNTENANRKRHR